MDKVNDTNGQDVGYALIKSTLGSIPILGTAVSELFGLVVTSPLEDRRIFWMNDVGERLLQLEKDGKVDQSLLRDNSQFLDTVLQATSYALKTSIEEKRVAFRNIILNTAVGDAPEITKSHLFLTSLDAFTGLHIKVLYFLNKRQEIQPDAYKIPLKVSGALLIVLSHMFSESNGDTKLMEVIIKDLNRAGFQIIENIDVMATSRITEKYTTPLGEQFIEFISRD
jgi:hypothetical protein